MKNLLFAVSENEVKDVYYYMSQFAYINGVNASFR